ncbi:hypothetical protein N3K66_004749 [Trichothecium roseum]|uniref:Uncharacterized protein n=1 Tax=Trichothecium roseum TaxID=47278 RepID=A0ACC0V294_9HYPO|nr:hypothetical protein N3K66_004749 [Trichothecium roseum]
MPDNTLPPPPEDKKGQQSSTARSWFHRNRSNKGSSSSKKKTDETEHRPQISGPIGPVINARGETLNRRDTFGLVEGVQDLVSPAAVAANNEDDKYDDDSASVTTIASTVISSPATRPVPPTPMSAAVRYGRYNRGMAPPAVASSSARPSLSTRPIPTKAPPRLADCLPGPSTNAPAATSSVFTGLNTPSMQQPTRPAPPVPSSPSVAASSSKHDSSSSGASTMTPRGQNAQDRISLGTIYGIETALTQPFTRFNLAESLRKPLHEVPAEEEEEEQPLDHLQTGPDGPPTIRVVPDEIPEKQTQESQDDEDEDEQKKPALAAGLSPSQGKRPAPISATPSSSPFLPTPVLSPSPFMSSSPFLSSPLEDAAEENDQGSDDGKTKDDSEDEEGIYTADDLHNNDNNNNDEDEDDDLARQFTGIKFHEQRVHVPNVPSVARSVSLAQPTQYWCGRYTALRDQELLTASTEALGLTHRHHKDTKGQEQQEQQELARTPSAGLQTLFRKRSGNPLSNTTITTGAATTAAAINYRKEEDMRSLRIIARLQTFCTTDAALASLREWQQYFARRYARPALLPPGGTMEDVDSLGAAGTGSSNGSSNGDDGGDADGETNDGNGSGSGSGGRKTKTGGRRRDLMNKILHPRHSSRRVPSPKK